MKALYIPTNYLHPVEPVDYIVDGMAEIIGAQYWELVRLKNPAIRLVVDEMGRYTNKGVNDRASRLYGATTGDIIVGDALLVGWDETATFRDEIELVDVPDNAISLF